MNFCQEQRGEQVSPLFHANSSRTAIVKQEIWASLHCMQNSSGLKKRLIYIFTLCITNFAKEGRRGAEDKAPRLVPAGASRDPNLISATLVR